MPPIVIEEIVPASAPPWSYVELSGLLPPSNFTVWFNGVDAPPFYLTRVNEMSTYTVRVIVPWDATSGPVTVGFYGTISTAYEFTVDPIDVKPEDIVPGVMSALFAPGANVPAIVAAMGNDPASAECSGLCTELGCWYGVDVTPGTEVSQSILYTRHPDVVWAQPVPVVLLEPGELSLTATPTAKSSPARLPSTGVSPGPSRGAGYPAIAALCLAATALALFTLAIRRRLK